MMKDLRKEFADLHRQYQHFHLVLDALHNFSVPDEYGEDDQEFINSMGWVDGLVAPLMNYKPDLTNMLAQLMKLLVESGVISEDGVAGMVVHPETGETRMVDREAMAAFKAMKEAETEPDPKRKRGYL